MGGRKDISTKYLFLQSPEVLFQNKCSRRNQGELAGPCSSEEASKWEYHC